MSDMNIICQFQYIWKIFTRVRAQTDRQTECINTSQGELLQHQVKKEQKKKKGETSKLILQLLISSFSSERKNILLATCIVYIRKC